MMRTFSLSLVLAVLGLFLVACQAATPTPSPVTVPKATPAVIPPPTSIVARMGDVVPEVGSKRQLALALLSWRESKWAVVGPYSGGDYYTFTAKPGMKFIILYYKFTNNWIREQEPPLLNEGEILTATKGYYYKVWSPPGGIHSTEYNPRKATQDETRLLGGDSGAFVTLLPEKSVEGRVIFEIPEDSKPVEAQLAYVPMRILFTE